MNTASKSRPILFSGPMVRAILDGRKTVTRRAIKPQPRYRGRVILCDWLYHNCEPERQRYGFSTEDADIPCPYGSPGDRLWVRETWSPIPEMKPSGYFTDPKWKNRTCWYAADNDRPIWGGKWKPSIFMPRAMSRITLEIKSVNIERLQDITEEDAIKEGFEQTEFILSRRRFELLWAELNGKESWAQNPWVWRIEFERKRKERDE